MYCHEKKIIHRDVKPLNIFLFKNNLVKLGDFGISRQINATEEQCGTRAGTKAYCPPEYHLGEKYSFAFDIWSLGVLFF